MTFLRKNLSALGLFTAITLAVVLSVSLFFRAGYYRSQMTAVYGQAFEVQWRAAQIREKTVSLIDKLKNIASKIEGSDDRRIILSEFNLLMIHISALLQLDYADQFLNVEDLRWLENTALTLDAELREQLVEKSDYQSAIPLVEAIRADIFRIVGDAVAHSQTVVESTYLESAAAQNEFTILVLSGLILVGALILQHNYFARRQHQLMRSLTSLLAHMTQSRFAGLRLFLQDLQPGGTVNSEMVRAAVSTVDELNSANQRILAIAHSSEKTDTIRLGILLETIAARHKHVRVTIDGPARDTHVPASQFELMIEELVVNAENAVEMRRAPSVTLDACVHRAWFRRRLIITVSDNGPGMTPDLLRKVTQPFFSTRAGHHLGLGLTCCSEVIRSMSGRFHISSKYGSGTSVQIVYPC